MCECLQCRPQTTTTTYLWSPNPSPGPDPRTPVCTPLQNLVERLHGVLRPFLLRRLKSEVEKEMPGKHEHVLHCRLSKRQRTLYEDYMASSEAAATLAGGNFLGVVNVLMQLRKVGGWMCALRDLSCLLLNVPPCQCSELMPACTHYDH